MPTMQSNSLTEERRTDTMQMKIAPHKDITVCQSTEHPECSMVSPSGLNLEGALDCWEACLLEKSQDGNGVLTMTLQTSELPETKSEVGIDNIETALDSLEARLKGKSVHGLDSDGTSPTIIAEKAALRSIVQQYYSQPGAFPCSHTQKTDYDEESCQPTYRSDESSRHSHVVIHAHLVESGEAAQSQHPITCDQAFMVVEANRVNDDSNKISLTRKQMLIIFAVLAVLMVGIAMGAIFAVGGMGKMGSTQVVTLPCDNSTEHNNTTETSIPDP